MTAVSARATVTDLYGVEGRAELVGGTIVRYRLGGMSASVIVGNLYLAFRDYERAGNGGETFTSCMTYVVRELPSGRETFSPSISYYAGPLPSDPMAFIAGPPTFAVEIRGEPDYTPVAVLAQEAKRVDYFQAGTLVVWDVDPVNEVIDCYRASAPTVPIRFVRGQRAHAEPAVPGWTILVNDVFE